MTYDWTTYKGNLKWLPARTIYLTRHGSHAYGTSLPTSDLDIRGIAIAPIHYYLGVSEDQGPLPLAQEPTHGATYASRVQPPRTDRHPRRSACSGTGSHQQADRSVGLA
jgi:hypothetical protein